VGGRTRPRRRAARARRRPGGPPVCGAAGAKCESLGYCPEAERFACGKYPTLKQLLAKS